MTQMARPVDFRDEIAQLINQRFGTGRKFAEATGLSEEEVSDLIATRKTATPDTLHEALGRIGYALHIAPVREAK